MNFPVCLWLIYSGLMLLSYQCPRNKPRQFGVFCACVAFLAQRAFSPALIYLALWGVVRKRYDQCVYQGFYSCFQSANLFFSNSRNYSLKLPSVKFLFQSCSAFSRALPIRYTVQNIQLHRKSCIQDLRQDTSISP